MIELNNYEKVEKLLEKYAEIDIDIKALEYQIKIEDIKGLSYNDMPGSPIPSNASPVEIQLNNIENLKIDKSILEFEKDSIDNMLRVLDDTEKTLIKYKFINKLQYKQIAPKMNMNQDYLAEKKSRIIDKLIPYALRYKLI
ncbi:hypothetical protein [Terrisporobacter petrolearius]|uniref:hypothetical protein n=1 Tax=Terrisporobacter petrolearius TaxID=1460447 RepID=UPI003AFFA414